MISALSSPTNAGSLLGTIAPFAAIPTPSTGLSTGPAYILDILGAAYSQGAAYGSSGQSTIPPDNTAAGRARKAELADAEAKLTVSDYSGARDAVANLVKGNSNDTTAIYLIGKSYMKEGNYDQAEKWLTRADSTSGGNAGIQGDLQLTRYLQEGKPAATQEVKRLVAQPTTSKQGAQLATYLLDQNPNNVDARLALVGFYEANGQNALAGQELNDAVATTAKDKLAPIVDYIKGFAARHSTDAGSYDLLGQGYAAIGQLSDATDAFNKALTLAQDDTQQTLAIKSDVAGIYDKIGQGKLATGDEAGAIAAFKTSLDFHATDTTKSHLSDLNFTLGKRALSAGDLTFASRYLNDARTYLPASTKPKDQAAKDLTTAFQSLSSAYVAKGDLKNSIGALNGAYLIDPKNDTNKRALADGYDTYGDSLAAQGNYILASKQYREALKLYKEDPKYTSHLNDAQTHV